MMNSFSFKSDVIYESNKPVKIYRVLYKDVCIAFFREAVRVKENTTFEEMANEYVRVYGYMAEHRRQWNLGTKVNWTEDLRVK